MSIMDHDPKYAKLRAWCEERRREEMHKRLRRTLEAVPRQECPYPVLEWRVITDPPEPWTEVVTAIQIIQVDFVKAKHDA